MKTSLIFCEPSSFNYANDYLVLDVDDKMLQLIYECAQSYQDDTGNAYVFGPLYDPDSYDHPGFIPISNGEIGFVEQTLAKRKHKANQLTSDYEKQVGKVKYNDPVYLAAVRKVYPEIRWIGQIFGKPPGVHLHFHVDDDLDRVDSIIIDNGYFYNVRYDSADEDTDEYKPTGRDSDSDSDDAKNDKNSSTAINIPKK